MKSYPTLNQTLFYIQDETMKNKHHECHYCHQPMKYRGNRIYICKNKDCTEYNKLVQYEPDTLPPNNKGIPDIYTDLSDLCNHPHFFKIRLRL